MGTPVPEDWPELIADKWYCVTEVAYTGPGGCTGPILGQCSCCRLGAPIQAYLDAGYECTFFAFLCEIGSPSPKRISCIKGPFDNKTLCEASYL